MIARNSLTAKQDVNRKSKLKEDNFRMKCTKINIVKSYKIQCIDGGNI